MKTVSIIIPFHSEPVYTVFNVLASINNQVGIDFEKVEVVLVNDGGPELPNGKDTFRLLKNLDIIYLRLREGHGPGPARQMGMNHAKGQYFMFMDADDQFHIDGALLDFFNLTDQNDYDLIAGKYMEQAKDINTGDLYYVFHNNNENYSIFSKWFNRNLIEHYHIRWANDLRVFEDTYFVGLAYEFAVNIKYIDAIGYTWLYNNRSTGRSTEKPGVSFDDQLHVWSRSRRYFLEAVQKYHPERVEDLFVNYVADIFYRQKKFEPVDPAEFTKENQRLLREFSSYWLPARSKIMQTIIDYNNKGTIYADLSNKDAVKFLFETEQSALSDQIYTQEGK
ncbi:glycosyltransferase family 2 protein [Loigolactobacillus binensis]|uniref:Glycosyltransferase family 2 protein n=1 Tax=Loigolactobacillus binensis TaxID=2559922 RepID=A0ABW3ED40_9LACO|nr:glycosyltransferase family 2 protein [Loigolactobacillus binensis]